MIASIARDPELWQTIVSMVVCAALLAIGWIRESQGHRRRARRL